MKNHYDYVKGKFAAWTKLKNKTGNVYDPSTNTFNLMEDERKIEMKDLVNNIFGNIAEEVSDHNLNGLDDIESNQMEPPTQVVSEESSVRSRNKMEFLTQSEEASLELIIKEENEKKN
ncbi:hypothetical protein QVD17_28548 [Tagetes erecta]|uniref:Uncharacterized protein n=1 Tax=Tagetes erecta TaxID=13708 RepID=A0AAD8KE15_TARER|nr:hypothetical protein QVD17_28548 [Tagetes erecta]